MLPAGLTLEEEREACRALKGSMLRQEVYADDAGPAPRPSRSSAPARPTPSPSRTSRIRALQPRGANRHAVFFTHAREAISYHYERNPADPRIQHALTLEVDDYGNVLQASRHRLRAPRSLDATLALQQADPDDQKQTHDARSPTPRTASPTPSSRADDAPHPAALRGAHLSS